MSYRRHTPHTHTHTHTHLIVGLALHERPRRLLERGQRMKRIAETRPQSLAHRPAFSLLLAHLHPLPFFTWQQPLPAPHPRGAGTSGGRRGRRGGSVCGRRSRLGARCAVEEEGGDPRDARGQLLRLRREAGKNIVNAARPLGRAGVRVVRVAATQARQLQRAAWRVSTCGAAQVGCAAVRRRQRHRRPGCEARARRAGVSGRSRGSRWPPHSRRAICPFLHAPAARSIARVRRAAPTVPRSQHGGRSHATETMFRSRRREPLAALVPVVWLLHRARSTLSRRRPAPARAARAARAPRLRNDAARERVREGRRRRPESVRTAHQKPTPCTILAPGWRRNAAPHAARGPSVAPCLAPPPSAACGSTLLSRFFSQQGLTRPTAPCGAPAHARGRAAARSAPLRRACPRPSPRGASTTAVPGIAASCPLELVECIKIRTWGSWDHSSWVDW